MKVSVKTLKGTHFQIEVKLDDSVADVKRIIETIQGSDVYPAAQQMLIHQGKVLKDDTTLEENNVAENSFIVIMLTKNKVSTSGATSGTTATAAQAAQPATAVAQATQPVTAPQAPAATTPPPQTASESTPAPAPASSVTDVYGQAASNLVAGNTLESTVQQILDMGGGSWDRDAVIRALRAAFNNPERAVEYLYSSAIECIDSLGTSSLLNGLNICGLPEIPSRMRLNALTAREARGIPEAAEMPPPAQAPGNAQAVNPSAPAPQPAVPSTGPNANPLDLFPQGLPTGGGTNASAGSLDFLRNSQQFQALRAMVQANPQILQPMLQELGKQNPQLMRLIQEHQADFLRLINEPVEGGEGNILGQLAEAIPPTVSVTPEEREAIERLEAMGFDPALVLQVFFACNKNEELAANYLLDHMHEFDE